MVSLNLINPKRLADHSLLTEHQELSSVMNMAEDFHTLKSDHAEFLKEKMSLLVERQGLVKDEMVVRGLTAAPNVKEVAEHMKTDFQPRGEDFLKHRQELIAKVMERMNFNPTMKK